MIPKITECAYDHVILNDDNPQIIHIKNFMSQEECDRIIQYIHTLPEHNATSLVNGVETLTDYRIAKTYTNELGKWATQDLMKADIEIMKLTNWKSPFTENWAFIKYGPGGKYKPHYDYLRDIDLNSNNGFRQRNGTFILYLKTADEGGHTCFPYLRETVKAESGDGIFFNYVAHETRDSFHGGTTVKSGEKIIATRWFTIKSSDEIVPK